jgi:uncharacterized membrane protein
MKKVWALLLTPFTLIGFIVGALVLAFVLITFVAFNPLVWLGLAGIGAILGLAVTIFLLLVIFGGVYYFLRDTGEPFQRTEKADYSLKQQEETGKKEQKV